VIENEGDFIAREVDGGVGLAPGPNGVDGAPEGLMKDVSKRARAGPGSGAMVRRLV
jgi:hypothetical protein